MNEEIKDILANEEIFKKYLSIYIKSFRDKDIEKFIGLFERYVNGLPKTKNGYRRISTFGFGNFLFKESTGLDPMNDLE